MNRPTARADWWASPHGHVLGGRDLQSASQGTWLGITKQGRVALLTNFREDGPKTAERSRGDIAKSYLVLPPHSDETPKQFAKRLVDKEGVQDVGGFSLIFGQLGKETRSGQRSPLGVISNRTPNADSVEWVAGVDSETQAWTCALSNSLYGDKEWPKVGQAQSLLDQGIRESVQANESEHVLIDRFFALLSTSRLPQRKPDEPWSVYTRKMRESIFIPAFGARVEESYGTQKQTVILVDHEGKVTFIERTLFDSDARPVDASERDRRFEFQIQA